MPSSSVVDRDLLRPHREVDRVAGVDVRRAAAAGERSPFAIRTLPPSSTTPSIRFEIPMKPATNSSLGCS